MADDNHDGGKDKRSKNKRKHRYGGSGGGVKRGGPAILFTCETGRETKCQREGLQILEYYFEPTEATDKQEEEKPASESKLSLEEELVMLKSNKKNRNKSEFFTIYETGCRGTIVAMCTLPNSSILPGMLVPKEQPSKDEMEKKRLCDDTTNNSSSKKAKPNEDNENSNKVVVDTLESPNPPSSEKDISSETTTTTNAQVATTTTSPVIKPPSWDPLDMVFRIMQDIKQESSSSSVNSSSHIPSSRFVTRMIPLQATCYASSEDIEAAIKVMLNRPLVVDAQDKTQIKTFSILVKRRICGNMTRDQVIDAVANVVGKECPQWKVNISNPDYRFQMELCKSLCGISILKRSYWKECQKFNLAEIRAPVS